MELELIKLGKENNIDIELFITHNDTTRIEICNGMVEKDTYSSGKRYSIKAITQGKTVEFSVPDIEDKEKIINYIKTTAGILDVSEQNSLAKPIKIRKEKDIIDKTNIKKIIKNIFNFEKVKEKYENIKEIRVGFTHELFSKNLINEKCNLKEATLLDHIWFSVVISKNGINETGVFYMTSKKLDFDYLNEKLVELIEDLQKKIDAVSCENKKYNIVLDGNCVMDILMSFMGLFNADTIDKNLSCLKGKENTKIFSDMINIIEDPSNKKYIGKLLFDSEGNKTKYKEIVKDGVFKTKLVNNKMANKYKIKPTGNSSGVRNLYIKPGNKTKEELIKTLKNGILIDKVTGLHAGVNTLTGDFSLQSEGYIIKNGKKEKALKLIVMTSSIFEIFNNVKEIGNDLEFLRQAGGCPSILTQNISISGQD